VTEGQAGDAIFLVSRTPPAFLCVSSNSSSDCTIVITVNVDPSIQELGCPTSGSISQIVLGASDPTAASYSDFCGQRITSSNWQNVLKILVVAKLDLIVDRDETSIVHVSGSLKTKEDITLIEKELQKVEVNFEDPSSSPTYTIKRDDDDYLPINLKKKLLIFVGP
jgi:hypothetical protein